MELCLTHTRTQYTQILSRYHQEFRVYTAPKRYDIKLTYYTAEPNSSLYLLVMLGVAALHHVHMSVLFTEAAKSKAAEFLALAFRMLHGTHLSLII